MRRVVYILKIDNHSMLDILVDLLFVSYSIIDHEYMVETVFGLHVHLLYGATREKCKYFFSNSKILKAGVVIRQ